MAIQSSLSLLIRELVAPSDGWALEYVFSVFFQIRHFSPELLLVVWEGLGFALRLLCIQYAVSRLHSLSKEGW